ncbi:MAG: hypothetical protein IKC31_00060 [Clostridia bacterium]|nr:hypothetical protein [Clostridia bacterium]MBR2925967.1 hypothetical protein [Clostridia bacterium]
MATLSEQELLSLAARCRIHIKEENRARLLWELEGMIAFSSVLQTEESEACDSYAFSHEPKNYGELRADEIGESLERDALLALAPMTEDCYLCVPRTLED